MTDPYTLENGRGFNEDYTVYDEDNGTYDFEENAHISWEPGDDEDEE